MIEISFGKLVLLALVALIVLGPEKLPGAARTAGALLRRMRSGWDNVRAEVERELEIEEIKRNAREVAAHADAAQKELDAAVDQVRDAQHQVVAGLDSMRTSLEAPPTGAQPAALPGLANEGADSDVADMSDAEPQRDLLTGDLFGDAPESPAHEPAEPPHGRI